MHLNFIVNQKFISQGFLYVAPYYAVLKYLTGTLKVYIKDDSTRNSSTFSNYIKNLPIEDNGIMVSLDITSLYTNIHGKNMKISCLNKPNQS